MCQFGLVKFKSTFLVQVATLFTARCSLSLDSSNVFPTANNAVSSGKVAIVLLNVFGT